MNDILVLLVILVAIVQLTVAAVLVYVSVTFARVALLQRHVLLILRHLEIDPTKTPELSDRVKELARDPARKNGAIKAIRDETGVGLAAAKEAIESYTRTLDR